MDLQQEQINKTDEPVNRMSCRQATQGSGPPMYTGLNYNNFQSNIRGYPKTQLFMYLPEVYSFSPAPSHVPEYSIFPKSSVLNAQSSNNTAIHAVEQTTCMVPQHQLYPTLGPTDSHQDSKVMYHRNKCSPVPVHQSVPIDNTTEVSQATRHISSFNETVLEPMTSFDSTNLRESTLNELEQCKAKSVDRNYSGPIDSRAKVSQITKYISTFNENVLEETNRGALTSTNGQESTSSELNCQSKIISVDNEGPGTVDNGTQASQKTKYISISMFDEIVLEQMKREALDSTSRRERCPPNDISQSKVSSIDKEGPETIDNETETTQTTKCISLFNDNVTKETNIGEIDPAVDPTSHQERCTPDDLSQGKVNSLDREYHGSTDNRTQVSQNTCISTFNETKREAIGQTNQQETTPNELDSHSNVNSVDTEEPRPIDNKAELAQSISMVVVADADVNDDNERTFPDSVKTELCDRLPCRNISVKMKYEATRIEQDMKNETITCSQSLLVSPEANATHSEKAQSTTPVGKEQDMVPNEVQEQICNQLPLESLEGNATNSDEIILEPSEPSVDEGQDLIQNNIHEQIYSRHLEIPTNIDVQHETQTETPDMVQNEAQECDNLGSSIWCRYGPSLVSLSCKSAQIKVNRLTESQPKTTTVCNVRDLNQNGLQEDIVHVDTQSKTPVSNGQDLVQCKAQEHVNLGSYIWCRYSPSLVASCKSAQIKVKRLSDTQPKTAFDKEQDLMEEDLDKDSNKDHSTEGDLATTTINNQQQLTSTTTNTTETTVARPRRSCIREVDYSSMMNEDDDDPSASFPTTNTTGPIRMNYTPTRMNYFQGPIRTARMNEGYFPSFPSFQTSNNDAGPIRMNYAPARMNEGGYCPPFPGFPTSNNTAGPVRMNYTPTRMNEGYFPSFPSFPTTNIVPGQVRMMESSIQFPTTNIAPDSTAVQRSNVQFPTTNIASGPTIIQQSFVQFPTTNTAVGPKSNFQFSTTNIATGPTTLQESRVQFPIINTAACQTTIQQSFVQFPTTNIGAGPTGIQESNFQYPTSNITTGPTTIQGTTVQFPATNIAAGPTIIQESSVQYPTTNTAPGLIRMTDSSIQEVNCTRTMTNEDNCPSLPKLRKIMDSERHQNKHSNVTDKLLEKEQNQIQNIMHEVSIPEIALPITYECHTWDTEIKCHLCDMKFYHVEQKQKHLQGFLYDLPHSERQCIVKGCTEELVSRKHFFKHLKTHGEGVLIPFDEKYVCHKIYNQCMFCRYVTPSPFMLKGHLGRRHCKMYCEECRLVFESEEEFKEDKKNCPNRYTICEVCGKRIALKGIKYIEHMETHQHESNQTSHRYIHVCKHCKETFPTYLKFNTHMRYHCPKKNYRKYECEHCNKVFKRKKSLSRHLDTFHLNEQCEKEPCKICGKLKMVKWMKEHINLHNRIQKMKCFNSQGYTCDVCKSTFSTKALLTYHCLVHTGEKKFKCKHCDKYFARSSNRDLHERIHTGDLRYKCDTCGKGFYNWSNWKTHLKYEDKLKTTGAKRRTKQKNEHKIRPGID